MKHEEITLKSVPGLLSAYLPALRPRRGTMAEGEALPGTALRVEGVRVDRERLSDYRKVCGFGDGDGMPLTFPMALAVPMQVALVTRPEWPLQAAGLVHLGIRITQHHPIHCGMPLTLRASVQNQAPHPRGIQFDLVVEAMTGDGTAWESHSVVLSRITHTRGQGKRGGGDRGEGGREADDWVRAGTLRATSNTGWHYARVSGDWNPIHLGALGARLFGYRRTVAHGMWTLARALSMLGHDTGTPGERLEAWFRAPLYLPGEAGLYTQPAGGTVRFQARESGGAGRVVLDGGLAGGPRHD